MATVLPHQHPKNPFLLFTITYSTTAEEAICKCRHVCEFCASTPAQDPEFSILRNYPVIIIVFTIPLLEFLTLTKKAESMEEISLGNISSQKPTRVRNVR